MSDADSRALPPLALLCRRLQARAEARRLSLRQRLVRRIGIPILDLARMLKWSPWLAPKAARQFGVPIRTQIRVQLRMIFREGVDPSLYYLAELYGPVDRSKLDQWLMRREVKGQLLVQLHRLLRKPGQKKIDLGDKMQFIAECAREGLPHPAPVVLIEDGRPVWQSENLTDLDQDLFVKPRTGRGAIGTSIYRRCAVLQYTGSNGASLSLDQVVSEVGKRSKSSVMILPRLRNHPAIADMATESLIAIRMMTCLDEKMEPELVDASLRVLSKLEPSWSVKCEYASAIDLETGRLGMMTGDQPECLSERFARHPVTGVQVVDREVPDWPAVVSLALRAHRLVRDRVLVGWDIALTPHGPMLLEGNSYPDPHFPQRIHQVPYGEMRFGTLLRFHLARLEAKWDAEHS